MWGWFFFFLIWCGVEWGEEGSGNEERKKKEKISVEGVIVGLSENWIGCVWYINECRWRWRLVDFVRRCGSREGWRLVGVGFEGFLWVKFFFFGGRNYWNCFIFRLIGWFWGFFCLVVCIFGCVLGFGVKKMVVCLGFLFKSVVIFVKY